MSLKVTLEEKPRVFLVKLGCNNIGQVTSFYDLEDANGEEQYYAERFTGSEDKIVVPMGWYATLKLAGVAIVAYAHGDTKIDNVTERIV